MGSLRMGVWCLILVAALCEGCATTGGGKESARLVGTLWWVSAADTRRTNEEWGRELEYMAGLGMDTIILNGPFVGGAVGGDVGDMEPFFVEADRRKVKVYIDTGMVGEWWMLKDAGVEIDRARKRIEGLERQYGKHECFVGLYIPYELYVFWGEEAELVRDLYFGVAKACKELCPEKKTMISPFFILDKEGYLGDFRWATAEEYEEFWREMLGGAEIDILALQDSGEHLGCYTLEQREPFFEAMRKACEATGTELWANVETGELNVKSMEEYVARFGFKTHVNSEKTRMFWRGVPAEKLMEKLRFAGKYTNTAITWGYREYVRPDNGPVSAELYTEYYKVLQK